MPEDYTRCFHCGEDCGPEPVMHDEKPFCCYGCKTVYEILRESDACEYYSSDQHPGIKYISPKPKMLEPTKTEMMH